MSLTNGGMPSLTEAELWRGYRVGIRTEPCACGGTITASLSEAKTLMDTLWAHYASPRHRTWRRRHAD